jgi:PEP-CTERM motif
LKNYLLINVLVSVSVVLFLILSVSVSSAKAIDYSFSGTAYIDMGGTWLLDDYSGLMAIESAPIIQSIDDEGAVTGVNWLINSFTVVSNNFNFLGNGILNLSGSQAGLTSINEPSIMGFGISPYFSGQMTDNHDGITAHYFYYDDGSEYERTFPAYIDTLPHMISGDIWNLQINNEIKVSLLYNNMVRVPEYVPVPEPSTILLLGVGLAGATFLRKRNYY